jgi:signal transduction histidine kinase
VSADRLEQLLVDLMDVSRMRSEGPTIRPEAMDLATLARSLVQRYADGSGHLHRVITHLRDGPVLVDGDQGRLEQVLDNMLSNAVKYTHAGGEITIRLGGVHHGSSWVTLGMRVPWAQDERNGAVLSVTDTGIGIPPEEQERIFEPFGRAANATRHGLPGMGMGLYICRQIVEAHGGRMWVESAGEGQGTTVGVWLPRGRVASEQATAQQGEA